MEGEPQKKPIAVKVTRHVREGENGMTARYEFPNNYIIFKLLSEAYPHEKEYSFYHFDNILVANNYSSEVDQFLASEAQKLGIILRIENRKPSE